MNTADRLTLFTRQDKIVLDTLYECGVARAKQEYVQRKYGSLPNFPAAYSVMRGLMEQTVPRAEGDESPFWLHGTAEATGIYSVDAPLITLSVPRDKCVLFDSRRWNRALNLCYIGSDAHDEAAFDAFSSLSDTNFSSFSPFNSEGMAPSIINTNGNAATMESICSMFSPSPQLSIIAAARLAISMPHITLLLLDGVSVPYSLYMPSTYVAELAEVMKNVHISTNITTDIIVPSG